MRALCALCARARRSLKIVLGEPADAGLLKSGIPTERNPDGSPVVSHPAFAPHPIQGWTPDFIPKVLEDSPMSEIMEELLAIPAADAIATAKLLAAKEGLLTGISGGGTMWAALETAKKAPKGSVILAMLPDTGERYLTTPLVCPEPRPPALPWARRFKPTAPAAVTTPALFGAFARVCAPDHVRVLRSSPPLLYLSLSLCLCVCVCVCVCSLRTSRRT